MSDRDRSKDKQQAPLDEGSGLVQLPDRPFLGDPDVVQKITETKAGELHQRFQPAALALVVQSVRRRTAPTISTSRSVGA